MEQEILTDLSSITDSYRTSYGCTYLDTPTVKQDIKEDKDLIKIKSKKLKLNFKN